MQKLYLSSLVFEITRKCNMACEHCLRGSAQNYNIKPSIVGKVMGDVDAVSSVTFSGGEPTMNPRFFTHFVDLCRISGRWPESFYIVTNCKKYSPAMIKALNELYNHRERHALDCVLKVSHDEYHEPYDMDIIDRYTDLPYYVEDRFSKRAYGLNRIINEGNAKENWIGTDEIESPVFIEGSSNEEYFEVQDVVYVNVHGDVILNCDFSYESQEKHKIGNVLEDSLIDILKRVPFSDWYYENLKVNSYKETEGGIAI